MRVCVEVFVNLAGVDGCAEARLDVEIAVERNVISRGGLKDGKIC